MRFRTYFILLLFLRCFKYVLNDEISNKKASNIDTGIEKDYDDRLLMFATLEGLLIAIDQQTGETKWKIKDKPIVQVPTNIQDAVIPIFLPDPRDGSLYVMGDTKDPLKKLPFTIPALVASSPCRSTDGILYTGKKKDSWYKLDPKTGNKEVVLGWDIPSPTCPIETSNFMYIGRTKYSLMMIDSRNAKRKWNVTYYDYTASLMSKEELNNYNYVHFASTSSGRLITMDRVRGNLVWDGDLGSPIVAAYILDPEGLISVPFTSLANHTLTYLASHHLSGFLNTASHMKLYPTLYVGQHNFGLYAIPSLVDSNVVTITTNGPDGPLLLGGPHAPKEPQPYAEYPIPGKNYKLPENLYNENNFQSIRRFENYIVLYTGHYSVPNYTDKFLISGRTDHIPLITDASKKEPRNFEKLSKETQTDTTNIEENKEKEILSDNKSGKNIYIKIKLWINQQDSKGLKLIVIVLFGCIIGLCWLMKVQARDKHLSQSGSNSSQYSNFGKNGQITASLEELPNGLVRVGKITFHPDQLLGKGCEGTFVYRGEFDSRRVAVKRLLPECFTFADREVALLRESDAHPHVIRYYCMEQDRMFRYIALELCQATLSEYIQGYYTFDNIKPLDILYQATSGLAHLHSLDIVHRDIKPHNVLLSVPNSRGEVRAMISDFGLCKKLQVGKMSFSRRSGVTGTEGWIAPEMLLGTDRITRAVDLFSLGCLYYYVLSRGSHPFGDALRRQANILSGEYNLSDLKASKWIQNIQITLLVALLSSEPKNRPECKVILFHPMFWSHAKILAFFQDVSDRVEKSDQDDSVLLALELNGNPVVKGDWRLHIHEEVAKDLRKYRTYKGNSVRDLLRALRNKKHHFWELTKEARELLGEIPDAFTNYWTSRFPLLLVHSWITMQIVSSEKTFLTYYHGSYKYSVDMFQQQVEDFHNQYPIYVSDEKVLEHFDKKKEDHFDYKSKKKYNKSSKTSFSDQSPKKFQKVPETEFVGLYRNLNNRQEIGENSSLLVEDVNVSVSGQRTYLRRNTSLRNNKKKTKSDEPLIWSVKE